jgi:nucleotide-binding universal stress UspA family protein
MWLKPTREPGDAEGRNIFRGDAMDEIKKIMVALAFSDYSDAIFKYAAKLAVDLNTELLIAHVIDIHYVEAISHVESMGYQVSSEDYVKNFKSERLSAMDEMASQANFPQHRTKKAVRVGHPYDQLLKLIKEEKPDLVVMGTRARSEMEQVLVGSVAEKVFHHSPVPVLFFRIP